MLLALRPSPCLLVVWISSCSIISNIFSVQYLHLSSQKWLKGMLGGAKWKSFACEASDIFATYYGGILAEGARRWARSGASALTTAAAGMQGA